MPNLAESAVRMTCRVKISGESAQTFVLQVRMMGKGNANRLKISSLNMLKIL